MGDGSETVRSVLARRTVLLGGISCGISPVLADDSLVPTSVPARLPNPSRPGTRLDNRIAETRPFLNLLNPHTGERWTGLFGREGSLIPESKPHLDHFLRDWRRNISVPFCYRVLWGLARMTQELELEKPLIVLSGYRTPETNSRLEGAAPNSLHMQGRAIDISSSEIASGDLFKLASNLEIGGTGWYPTKGFVHIDSGHLRRWQA